MCVIIVGWFKNISQIKNLFPDLFVVLLTEGPLVGEVGVV